MTVVNDFINDNYKMRNRKIVVIHGKGLGILKRKIHDSLKRNKLVDNYYLYNMNIGCTIIELKERE
ncbi:MAG: Smr/MutS family protein [Erysipelotrichales bacterium]|nr:Smr/MutS family protein [Erysipelotrichales bacterium]